MKKMPNLPFNEPDDKNPLNNYYTTRKMRILAAIIIPNIYTKDLALAIKDIDGHGFVFTVIWDYNTPVWIPIPDNDMAQLTLNSSLNHFEAVNIQIHQTIPKEQAFPGHELINCNVLYIHDFRMANDSSKDAIDRLFNDLELRARQQIKFIKGIPFEDEFSPVHYEDFEISQADLNLLSIGWPP